MVFLSNLMGMLALRSHALKMQAESRMILGGIVCFSTGFLTYLLVRNQIYSALPEIMAQPIGPIRSFYHLNLIQALLFLLFLYIPALILLSGSIFGQPMGLTISGREYRMHASVLLPLWGLLFLISAPVQWIIPRFLIVGMFEISIGFLVCSILLALYTAWAIRHLNCLNIIQAAGACVLSWFLLPVFYLLMSEPFITALFILAPLLFWCGRWVRKHRASRKNEALLQKHLADLSSDPGNADSSFQAGKIILERGNPDEASGYFENALRADPGNPDYGYNLGRAYEMKGDWDSALQLYEGIYNLDPEYESGRIVRELGKVYVHLDRIDRGREFLGMFLEKNDNDSEARFWMAVALQRAGKTVRMLGELNLIMGQARTNSRAFCRANRHWICRARDMLRQTRHCYEL